MSTEIAVTGMVLSAMPIGEYDKRLVILTRELGRISAFARGARRQGSPLLAASRPFAFGTMSLFAGRTAYTIRSMEISNYFDDLSSDLEAMCYASYFAEFAAYYTRENVDETQMLKLLYQSVRALLNKNLPNSLVKVIYEIKAMVLNGEYQENPPCQVSSGARYALEFIITTPVEKLYTFVLTEPVLKEVEKCAEIWKKMFIDRKFQSLEILESIL